MLARRTAELAVSSAGNVNIALFGPWGLGKSSFNALLREELRKQASKTQHITFDAWKNADTGFRTNFLSEVAAQLNTDVKTSDGHTVALSGQAARAARPVSDRSEAAISRQITGPRVNLLAAVRQMIDSELLSSRAGSRHLPGFL